MYTTGSFTVVSTTTAPPPTTTLPPKTSTILPPSSVVSPTTPKSAPAASSTSSAPLQVSAFAVPTNVPIGYALAGALALLAIA